MPNHETCSEVTEVGRHCNSEETCWESEFLALNTKSAPVEFFHLSSVGLTDTTKQTFPVNRPALLALCSVFESPKSPSEDRRAALRP